MLENKNNIKNLDINKQMESINKFKVRSEFHTHVSMGSLRGKYNFNREGMNLLHSSNLNKLTIAEKPQKYLPVLVDIDIKRKISESTVSRTSKHVIETIKIYQDTLKCIVKDITPKQLTCIFLDKKSYEIGNHKKEGFHLHFPYLFLNKTDQSVHLIPRVREQMNKIKLFNDLGFENCNSIVDDVTNNAWLMYGCSKDINMEAYTISKIFNDKTKVISIEKGLINYPLYDGKEKLIPLKNTKDIEKNLSRILSIIPFNRPISDLKIGLVNPLKEVTQEKRQNVVDYPEQDTDKLLDTCKTLLSIINKKRAESREDWLKIGWILYNISNGSDKGFIIWDKFSQQCSDKYRLDVNEHTWSKMKITNGLSIGTLHYFSKEDNPSLYKKWCFSVHKNKITESLNGSHYDLAEIFYNMYGKDNVRITSQKDLSCFIWNDKTKLWVETGKETLCRNISYTLTPIYSKIGTNILGDLAQCRDKGEEAMHNARLKQVQKLITSCRSTPYINNIVKAYAGFDIDSTFETDIINRNKHELPIRDGKIINLKTLEIRQRTKEDYWSFECDVDFLGEKADLNHVEKFFSDISCGDKDLIDYHRRLWGYLMTGEITDRSLHIFWGDGCNGKSSIVKIFKNIMNNFACSLSEDVMLKKTGRGASPELMDLLTARAGILPESDKEEEINSKRVKTITGDDEINARSLFGHPIKFYTQCKPIWATNFKPKINIDDQAILDRLKLIPFLGRFEKNQINTSYITDLQENHISEFFTYFAMGAYDWYNGSELLPCKAMTDEMDRFISENDVIAEFLEDSYDTISEEDYDKLPNQEKQSWRTKKSFVYGMFVSWVNENSRKDDGMMKKDFNKQIEKYLGERKVKGVRSFLCKIKEEMEEEGEEGNCLPPM
jgi:P4 family phage/plasmid primase-like protien